VLPPKGGNYADLQAIKGKLLYRRQPRTGSAEEKNAIVYFDFAEREEKTVLDDADAFETTADGKKILVLSKKKYAILDIKAGQKFEKPMVTADMEAPVDPRAEWRQIFRDVYRFERDFFYDPTMHGVNWEALGERYSKVLEGAVTRWDVDFLIGEFIGELNASHTYHGGGDMEQAPQRSVGLLGVDWELSNGFYRIKHIVRGGPWDSSVRSPLDESGVQIKEGGIRAGGQRHSDRHEIGSVGIVPGSRRQDGRPHRQLVAVLVGREAGGREMFDQRNRITVSLVD
jgi:tricorn protease